MPYEELSFICDKFFLVSRIEDPPPTPQKCGVQDILIFAAQWRKNWMRRNSVKWQQNFVKKPFSKGLQLKGCLKTNNTVPDKEFLSKIRENIQTFSMIPI